MIDLKFAGRKVTIANATFAILLVEKFLFELSR